jgi:hypothetical protein
VCKTRKSSTQQGKGSIDTRNDAHQHKYNRHIENKTENRVVRVEG